MSINISDIDIKVLFKKLWESTITASFYKYSNTLSASFSEPEKYDAYFDYHCGKPMKLDLRDLSSVSTRLYNRDAGDGVFEKIVKELRNNF